MCDLHVIQFFQETRQQVSGIFVTASTICILIIKTFSNNVYDTDTDSLSDKCTYEVETMKIDGFIVD